MPTDDDDDTYKAARKNILLEKLSLSQPHIHASVP